MVEIYGGQLVAEPYLANQGGGEGTVGALIVAAFKPDTYKLKQEIDSTGSEWRFDLIQVVRDIPVQGGSGQAVQGNVGFGVRAVQSGTHAGWGVDMEWMTATDDSYRAIARARKSSLENRVTELGQQIAVADPGGLLAAELAVVKRQQSVDKFMTVGFGGRAKGKALTSLDPRYAQQRLSEDIPPFTEMAQKTGGNMLVLNSPYTVGDKRATLRDLPSTPIRQPVTGMEFEIGVLFEYGAPGSRRRRYVGSMKWGWTRTAGKSDVSLNTPSIGDRNGVTAAFTAAVSHWNRLTVADPQHATQYPMIGIPAS